MKFFERKYRVLEYHSFYVAQYKDWWNFTWQWMYHRQCLQSKQEDALRLIEQDKSIRLPTP